MKFSKNFHVWTLSLSLPYASAAKLTRTHHPHFRRRERKKKFVYKKIPFAIIGNNCVHYVCVKFKNKNFNANVEIRHEVVSCRPRTHRSLCRVEKKNWNFDAKFFIGVVVHITTRVKSGNFFLFASFLWDLMMIVSDKNLIQQHELCVYFKVVFVSR